MNDNTFYVAGKTPSARFARHYLSKAGIAVTSVPDWNTSNLLLDVPSFQPGLWQEHELDTLLSSFSQNIIIWGGNLRHEKISLYKTSDLLTDETYLTENAALTADCTIPLAEAALHRLLQGSAVLLIGWGRITKALASRLTARNANVFISSRNPSHRTQAISAGFQVLDTADIPKSYDQFHLVINTAPAPVLSVKEPTDTVLMDLASIKGIDAPDVIWARALPGRYAPDRSGKLIADTIIRRIREVSP